MPSFGYGVAGAAPNRRAVFVSFSQNSGTGLAPAISSNEAKKRVPGRDRRTISTPSRPPWFASAPVGPNGRSFRIGSRPFQERVELHDIGPWRKVRVAAGQHMPSGRHPVSWIGLDVVFIACTKSSGLLVTQGWSGGDVVGHVVQEQPHSAGGQGGARRGQRVGAAEGGVDDVPAHAVRRSDNVLTPQVG
jgi:hypothetical protein